MIITHIKVFQKKKVFRGNFLTSQYLKIINKLTEKPF